MLTLERDGGERGGRCIEAVPMSLLMRGALAAIQERG